MDALEISTFGEPSDVVEQVTIPDPDSPIANEVLVAVEYAPIDHADFLTIRGTTPGARGSFCPQRTSSRCRKGLILSSCPCLVSIHRQRRCF